MKPAQHSIAMEQSMSAHQVLDLRYKHFQFNRGDLTLIGTWMRDVSQQYRPCMVIIRTGEEKKDDTRPCIIPVDRAWIWDELIGDGRQCATTTTAFLQSLRIRFSKKNAFRLHSLINDHLGDLLNIPPIAALGLETETVAEVTRIDMETGEVIETEVKAHV